MVLAPTARICCPLGVTPAFSLRAVTHVCTLVCGGHQVSSSLLSEARSLSVELTSLARLVVQSAPGVALSLTPQF